MSDNDDLKSINPVENVYGFSIQGHSNSNIMEFLETQELTPENARNVLEQALNKFIKSANLPKTARRGWCLEAYRELYRKLFETGDYSGALKAIKEIANLAELSSAKAESAHEIKDEIDEYIDNMMELNG